MVSEISKSETMPEPVNVYIDVTGRYKRNPRKMDKILTGVAQQFYPQGEKCAETPAQNLQ